MADPLSIAASCVGIISGIASVSLTISRFVGDVRGAKKDLDDVNSELSSLQLSLTALSQSGEHFGFDDSPTLKQNMFKILGDCSAKVDSIEVLLAERKPSLCGLGSVPAVKKIKWAAGGKTKIMTAKVGLESHKASLDIALQLIGMLTAAGIRRQVTVVKDDTSKIIEMVKKLDRDFGAFQSRYNLDRAEISKESIQRAIFESLSSFETRNTLPPSVPVYVVKRISRRSYGIQLSDDFTISGASNVSQHGSWEVDWFLQKGDDVATTDKFEREYTIRTGTSETVVFKATLVSSDRDGDLISLNLEDIKVVGEIQCIFSQLQQEWMEKQVDSQPKTHRLGKFTLIMALGAAILGVNIRIGRLTVEDINLDINYI